MKTRSGFRRLLRVVALLMVLAPTASFGENIVKIKDAALNNIASVAGLLQGSGHHVVSVPYQCFACTRYENTALGRVCTRSESSTCQQEVFSANYSWRISNVQFRIQPSGISYTGTLTASYGALSLSIPVSGTGAISVSNSSFVISFPGLNVPLTFNVPSAGSITVFTVSIPQPYRVSVPITYVRIYGQSGNVRRTIVGRVLDPTYELKDGEVTVRANAYFW